MKNKRQQVMIELIKSKIISTQETLQSELQNLGFTVTQATVSRDIKALNIIKALDRNGNYRYIVSTDYAEKGDRYNDIFAKSVIEITAAMNDVVVKCYSGTASAAAAAIDRLYSDKFIGSLAGDDTIFIITRDENAATELVEELKNLIS